MSTPIISRRSDTLADGTHALFIRFSFHGEKIRTGLKMSVKAEDWDADNRRIRGRSEAVKLLNNRLSKAVQKASQIIWMYELLEKHLTQELFDEEFWQKASREDFLPWMREEIQRQYNRRLINGYTKWDHLHIAEKIEAFCDVLPYSLINRGWLEKFDAWHAKQQQAAGYDGGRAREKALKCIRKYLKAAEGSGKEFTDPFDGFTWPKWKSSPVWLEEMEVRTLLMLFRDRLQLEVQMAAYARRNNMREFDIERYLAPENVEVMHQRIRSFLFQCFVGARYSDIQRLSWEEHVKEDVIVFKPVKTSSSSGKSSTVPITEVIMELLLDGAPTPPTRGKILRVPSNQKYNKGLKVLADVAGIQKPLTSHVGRHTFGALMIAGGVSVVSLMEMMGLTKIDTAMIYIHSSLEQQAREIKRAQEGFLLGS